MVAGKPEILEVEAGVGADWTVMVCIFVWMIIKVVVETRGTEFAVPGRRERVVRIGMRSCILRTLVVLKL
jgi:hypothetical protein